jgi:hypothetical protein
MARHWPGTYGRGVPALVTDSATAGAGGLTVASAQSGSHPGSLTSAGGRTVAVLSRVDVAEDGTVPCTV